MTLYNFIVDFQTPAQKGTAHLYCTHMLMNLEKLAGPLGSVQDAGPESEAAVGYNQIGPLWPMRHELQSQSTLTFMAAALRTPDGRTQQESHRKAGRKARQPLWTDWLFEAHRWTSIRGEDHKTSPDWHSYQDSQPTGSSMGHSRRS